MSNTTTDVLDGLAPALNLEGKSYYDVGHILSALASVSLEIPRYHITEKIKSGVIKGQKVGRRYLVEGESFTEWLSGRK